MRKERDLVMALRGKGLTYKEIQEQIGIEIPKGTISHWCTNVPMSKKHRKRIETLNLQNLKRGRDRALELNREKREVREQEFLAKNQPLLDAYLNQSTVRKTVLAILHLAEGHKRASTVVFGNSDPEIISMFMDLLRSTYEVDEKRFRVTVQCRADQNTEELTTFWSKLTCVPLTQFYKPQVDKRTLGKPTKKPSYRGVCRIDYLSVIIDQELKYIAKMLKTM